MLRELKEVIDNKLKKTRISVWRKQRKKRKKSLYRGYQQRERNYKNERPNRKLVLERYNNQNKDSLEIFNNRVEQAEKRISKFEDKSLRFSSLCRRKEKTMKKNEESLKRPVGHYRMYQYMHIYRWEFLFLKNLFIFVLTHCRRFQKYKEEK